MQCLERALSVELVLVGAQVPLHPTLESCCEVTSPPTSRRCHTFINLHSATLSDADVHPTVSQRGKCCLLSVSVNINHYCIKLINNLKVHVPIMNYILVWCREPTKPLTVAQSSTNRSILQF